MLAHGPLPQPTACCGQSYKHFTFIKPLIASLESKKIAMAFKMVKNNLTSTFDQIGQAF